jgi:hypothetical protein
MGEMLKEISYILMIHGHVLAKLPFFNCRLRAGLHTALPVIVVVKFLLVF